MVDRIAAPDEEPSTQRTANPALLDGPLAGLPQRINLDNARPVEPSKAPVSRTPMSELEQAAVLLAAGVIAVMAAIASMILYAAYKGEFNKTTPDVAAIQKLLDRAEAHYAAASAPETLDRATQLMTQMRESRRESRKVWIDLAQMLLINIFLPVLTALLGYVFGTMNAGARGREHNQTPG